MTSPRRLPDFASTIHKMTSNKGDNDRWSMHRKSAMKKCDMEHMFRSTMACFVTLLIRYSRVVSIHLHLQSSCLFSWLSCIKPVLFLLYLRQSVSPEARRADVFLHCFYLITRLHRQEGYGHKKCKLAILHAKYEYITEWRWLTRNHKRMCTGSLFSSIS